MPQAPVPRAGCRSGDRAPVIGESLMPGGSRFGNDRVGPVVVGHDGLGGETPLGPGQPAGLNEDPETLHCSALPAVRYVLVILQRCPVAGRGGHIPDGTARPGPVEVDQADCLAIAEYKVRGM